jgi:hypothetical protein
MGNGPDMSVLKFNAPAFYLQKYYLREWTDNTMIFVVVEDVDPRT